ncbi:MAG TPA: pitrilysin family protein [Polyangiaceae bacterium]|nr:pitrilysin family protein [Polyangiaceae bacterium]
MTKMQGSSARRLLALQKHLNTINASAPEHGKLELIESIPFGASLSIDRFRLSNGLQLLLCEDRAAPVVSVHTWFKVGSRHEQEGKTGLAHLFEHLMFNEIEGRGPGEFDRKLEEAGAESNASTWLDWTQYNIAIPKDQLGLVLKLEAERMGKLVLREPQVTSEKEVVANERRYRVDDDVEGAVSELLWATAFTRHAYKWPTIGWMKDIEGFTTGDCEAFYRAYYAPNNAALIISGDFKAQDVLRLVSQNYGVLSSSTLPIENAQPEPPQTSERRVEVKKPTATEKLVVGYHAPALGDFDHPAISLLSEVLFGGRASRMHQRLVRELELASEVRAFVGPFHDPGLFELYAAAREGHTAEELLTVIDQELTKVVAEPVAQHEMDRAAARFELGLLGGLETADGKASTIGFYEAVLGRPAAAFERLEATRRLTQSDLLRAARRYLDPRQRSVIFVRPELGKAASEAAE